MPWDESRRSNTTSWFIRQRSPSSARKEFTGRPVLWVATRHTHAGVPISSLSVLRRDLESTGRADLCQLPQSAATGTAQLRPARLRPARLRPARLLPGPGIPPTASWLRPTRPVPDIRPRRGGYTIPGINDAQSARPEDHDSHGAAECPGSAPEADRLRHRRLCRPAVTAL